MKIAASTIDGILIVSLGEGQIVASNVDPTRLEIEAMISANPHKVLLDLGLVSFMDSSGLGLLVAIMKRVNRAGGVMRVAGLGPQPLALFRTVNLDRVMPLSRDVEEALMALRDTRAGARKVLTAEDEQSATEEIGKIEQIVAHARLSYEALFGSMPEDVSLDLRALLQRHLRRRQGDDKAPAVNRLPAALEEAGVDLSAARAAPEQTAVASVRVLIMDDEEMVCDLLKDILSTMGCDVIVCQSGREGLEHFGVGRFDLVMTDLAMPGMNGWEVVREIRSRDATVPIALFSAWGSQVDAGSLHDRGIDFLFPKPFEISMIRNVLSAALDLGRERGSLRMAAP
jgi:anti-anti-sigma factor